MKFIKDMEQDLDRFLSGLKGASSSELGMVVVFANHWRNILEQQFGWNLDAPDMVMMNDNFAGTTVNKMLRDVQKKEPASAAGLMVWLHSLRASQVPEIRTKGREMWSELARGIPHAKEAADGFYYSFGVEIDTTGVERIPENLGPLTG